MREVARRKNMRSRSAKKKTKSGNNGKTKRRYHKSKKRSAGSVPKYCAVELRAAYADKGAQRPTWAFRQRNPARCLRVGCEVLAKG